MAQKFARKLAALRQKYLCSATGRVGRLDQILAQLETPQNESAASGRLLSDLLRGFHSFVGSGATYGLPQISKLAQEGEVVCEVAQTRQAVTPDQLAKCRRLLTEIHQQIRMHGPSGANQTAARVLLLASRSNIPCATGSGSLAVDHVTSLQQAARRIAEHTFVAIVLDSEGGAQNILALARKFINLHATHRTPLFVLWQDCPPARQFELVQAGCAGVLDETTAIDDLAQQIQTAHQVNEDRAAHVVLLLAESLPKLVAELRAQQYRVDLPRHPDQLVSCWREDAIDLIILEPSSISGSVAEFRNTISALGGDDIAIIVVGHRDQVESTKLAFRDGADEWLPFDYSAAEFRSRVVDRLELRRLQRRRQRRSRLTTSSHYAVTIPAKDQGDLRRSKVLLADDDPTISELLAFHLTNDGWTVSVASDGEQALRLLESDNFQLAIVDLNMPLRSGFELLQWRKRQAEGPPMVVLTAMHQDSAVRRAFSEGAADFIPKPFDPNAVASRLQRFM